MKWVEPAANKIAIAINSNASNPSSVAVLKYSLINLINLAIFMAIVIIVSIVTGDFIKALIAIVAFPIIRYFTGGLHFKSENVCNVVSSILVLICVYSTVDFWYTGFVLNTIALAVLVLRAPANVPRSNLKKHEVKYLKMIVVVIVALNFYFESPVLSLVFFMQALTTLPGAQQLLDKYKI